MASQVTLMVRRSPGRGGIDDGPNIAIGSWVPIERIEGAEKVATMKVGHLRSYFRSNRQKERTDLTETQIKYRLTQSSRQVCDDGQTDNDVSLYPYPNLPLPKTLP